MSGGASRVARVLRAVLWIGWQALRLPLFVLLVIFEPIVRFVLSFLALLTASMALFFGVSGAAPRFPLLRMMAFAIVCYLALMSYYALLRMVS
jgi:hypothetical protein